MTLLAELILGGSLKKILVNFLSKSNTQLYGT